MGTFFTLQPIGTVKKQQGGTYIEILSEYQEGLRGLEQFSHVVVLFWFHRNDTAKDRRTLKVHPRRNPANPLTGVFATRSPVRPNLIGIAVCRLIRVDGNVLQIDDIDALPDTPVLDLKPCMSPSDVAVGLRVAEWADRDQDE